MDGLRKWSSLLCGMFPSTFPNKVSSRSSLNGLDSLLLILKLARFCFRYKTVFLHLFFHYEVVSALVKHVISHLLPEKETKKN